MISSFSSLETALKAILVSMFDNYSKKADDVPMEEQFGNRRSEYSGYSAGKLRVEPVAELDGYEKTKLCRNSENSVAVTASTL